MYRLEMTGVTFAYAKGRRVVDRVSVAVSDGETLTMLGPSGCGKSTLLRLIAGLERPDEGEIRIDGARVNDIEPPERDVAMVFQSYALYPHMTVFENIAAPLRLRKAAKEEIRRRVEETAGMLGIERHLSRPPRELSGGERQRVALARALVRRPRLFLLDEPLSNLDAQLRERARSDLKALFQRLRATVVYVTHDQTEAMTLSDRMGVMREGRVEQVGTPEEVYGRPATSFVAAFVGSPRINLLPASLFSGGAHTIGIRPEDVELAAEGPLEGSVILREPMGAQQLVTVRVGDQELRVLVPSGRTVPASVRLKLDPARIHSFRPDGARIQ